nr:hypothetical protein [Tanacetum cinerariifolium]GEZ76549.1 hypothetical protein [Tanacetum cinerariifolium]
MCVESWSQISFARALFETSLDKEIKEEVVMAIPVVDNNGYTKATVRVEYEWKPPHCIDFQIFRHSHDNCPKRMKEPVQANMAKPSDGFTEVTV